MTGKDDEHTQPIWATGLDSNALTRRTPPNGTPQVSTIYLGRHGAEDLNAAAVRAVQVSNTLRDETLLSELERQRAIIAALVEEGYLALPSARQTEVESVADRASQQAHKHAAALAGMILARGQAALISHQITDDEMKGVERAAKWLGPNA